MGDHPIPGWWTVTGVAELTGLHPDTIRWHCREGQFRLCAVAAGRGWNIPDNAVDTFIRDRLRRGKVV